MPYLAYGIATGDMNAGSWPVAKSKWDSWGLAPDYANVPAAVAKYKAEQSALLNPTPAAAPRDYNAEAAEKKNQESQRAAAVNAKGGAATIFAGGLGDYAMAPTGQRTLLGG